MDLVRLARRQHVGVGPEVVAQVVEVIRVAVGALRVQVVLEEQVAIGLVSDARCNIRVDHLLPCALRPLQRTRAVDPCLGLPQHD